MLKSKLPEDSDSEDSDFVVNSEDDLSDNSVPSDSKSLHEDSIPFTTDGSQLITRPSRGKLRRTNIQSRKIIHTRNSRVSRKLTPDRAIESTTENEKKRADSLWDDFLSNTVPISKSMSEVMDVAASRAGTSYNFSMKNFPISEADTKPTNSDSIESNDATIDESYSATLLLPGKPFQNRNTTSASLPTHCKSRKRGISNVLSHIDKKSKLTTIEKSKLQWDEFKKQNDLSDEISNFNRGKRGYLEKQDFLQRTDTRQFEIEKELRNKVKRRMH